MTSARKVSELKLDIEKSVKREGTFDAVRKQAFAIVNSDGFLDELQVGLVIFMRTLVYIFLLNGGIYFPLFLSFIFVQNELVIRS